MPKLVEVKVSYSVGMKANIGNYESADFHMHEGETWDVTDMEEAEVEGFVNKRKAYLNARLGEDAVVKFERLHEGEL